MNVISLTRRGVYASYYLHGVSYTRLRYMRSVSGTSHIYASQIQTLRLPPFLSFLIKSAFSSVDAFVLSVRDFYALLLLSAFGVLHSLLTDKKARFSPSPVDICICW